jgi:hypothetical protein
MRPSLKPAVVDGFIDQGGRNSVVIREVGEETAKGACSGNGGMW